MMGGMADEKEYIFVGGRFDGARLLVPGDPPAGGEVRLPLQADPSKSEVYVLGGNGQFQFIRYSYSNLPLGPDLAREDRLDGQVLELLARVEPALRELAAHFRTRGGFPTAIEVGEWVIKPRE